MQARSVYDLLHEEDKPVEKKKPEQKKVVYYRDILAAQKAAEQRQSSQQRQPVSTGAQRRNHTPPVQVTLADKLAKAPEMWIFDIIVTLIVCVGLFWVYGSFYTNIESGHKQHAVQREISGLWGDRVSDVDTVNSAVGDPWMADKEKGLAEGDPLMKIHIPRLGDDWDYTVVKGVSNESLAKGPGFYTSTQYPGQLGNTGIAGHRDGRGAPFFYLDHMRTCDVVALETKGFFYIYRVLPGDLTGTVDSPQDRHAAAQGCLPKVSADVVAGTSKSGGAVRGAYSSIQGVHVVKPENNKVIAPVPSDMKVPAGQTGLSMLTLTTCNPLYFNYERLIVHAALEDIVPVDGQSWDDIKGEYK